MIVSVNLNTIPFLSSTDSTRASMSAKQIQQALTSLNCEPPFVIGSDYRTITNTSKMGCIRAKDSGEVLYRSEDILIVQYTNLNKIQDIYIPPIKKTTSSFGTKLRFVLPQGSKFEKGDILANYDCFVNGVPSYGYNVFTAYMPFFGFNHEDAITISESLADRARYTQIDKVYIPIYEYTLMQELYKNDQCIYFPGIGQKINDDIVCCMIAPKDGVGSDPKNKIQMALKNMSLSDLLNVGFSGDGKFAIDKIRTKVTNGIVSGIKIHKFKKSNTQVMIDRKLETILDQLYLTYGVFVVKEYKNLLKFFNYQYMEYILSKYYVFHEKTKGFRGEIELNNLCYLIELEVFKDSPTVIGDKLANRSIGRFLEQSRSNNLVNSVEHLIK